MTAPRVFSLPPGADFAAGFARGYHRLFGDLPLAVRARGVVLVNTARASAEITAALADHAPRQGVLPTIRMIPDLGDDPALAASVPQAVPSLRRQLHLTRLVETFLAHSRAAGTGHTPSSAAADLAESLAFLIDQFHDHGVAFDRLKGLEVAERAAHHWQQSLAFLDIVLTAWPEVRADDEGGRLDPRDRQGRLIDAVIADLRAHPPDHPVVVAASTGSVGTTARLMAAVASLPMGAVVLPGLDPAIEPAIWEAATADHPMGPFRGFFEAVGMTPADVEHWEPQSPSARLGLMTQAMRPAPVTDHWHEAAKTLCETAAEALEGLSLIEAESPRHEAAAIAVAIREALAEPGAEVALITPDGALARRVTAALDRFGIVPDDTMGAPLSQSVPGALLALMLDAARPDAGALDIAALLQHPLVSPGVPRARHLEFARSYERRILRDTGTPGGLAPDPKAGEEAAGWLAGIRAALAPVTQGLADRAPLGEQVTATIAALGALTDAGDGEGPRAWLVEGADLRLFLDELAANADAGGGQPVTDFPALLSGLMRGRQVRPRTREHHPRVRIVGTREARIEGATRVILAGINDGVWPAPADPGPWLSRPMHEALGLPLPERAVGLSAHDFLHAACRPHVIMSRSVRAEGAPTVASRWLVRLETLLTGIQADDEWQAVRDRGRRYLDLAAALDHPAAPVPRALRPRPVPPRDAIPRELPVTQVETLIRDAYAVYARYVLGLRALGPLGRRPDMRERGQLLHRLMERFVERTLSWPGPEAARAVLMTAADELLAAEPVPPDLRRAWRGRIGRFADWLVRAEDARRDMGEPLAWERTGAVTLPVAGEDFILTARADRIDRLADGTGAIYDYKSGHPPGKGQIEQRFNQQLDLAATILAAGGFKEVPPLPPSRGAYIGLTGGREGGREQVVDGFEDLDAYRDDLVRLLAAYLGGAPWVSRSRPELLSYESDYDHLARTSEWSDEEAS